MPVGLPDLESEEEKRLKVYKHRAYIVFGLLFVMAGILCILFPPAAVATSAIGLVFWDLWLGVPFLSVGYSLLTNVVDPDKSPTLAMLISVLSLLLLIVAGILCILFPPSIIAASGTALILWHVLGTAPLLFGPGLLLLVGVVVGFGYLLSCCCSSDSAQKLPIHNHNANRIQGKHNSYYYQESDSDDDDNNNILNGKAAKSTDNDDKEETDLATQQQPPRQQRWW